MAHLPTNTNSANIRCNSRTPTLHIIPTNSPPLTASSLSAIEHLPIPRYAEIPRTQSHDQDLEASDHRHSNKDTSESTTSPFIPGGGLTRRFLDSLFPSPPRSTANNTTTKTTVDSPWSIPTLALLQFVMEGDNRADAHLFASVITKVLEREPGSAGWKVPKSWETGLFGSDHDQTLYG